MRIRNGVPARAHFQSCLLQSAVPPILRLTSQHDGEESRVSPLPGGGGCENRISSALPSSQEYFAPHVPALPGGGESSLQTPHGHAASRDVRRASAFFSSITQEKGSAGQDERHRNIMKTMSRGTAGAGKDEKRHPSFGRCRSKLRECSDGKRRSYMTPCSSIASATLRNPAILPPRT